MLLVEVQMTNAETIAKGRNTMPAFANVFKPEQLRDVAGYVSKRLAK